MNKVLPTIAIVLFALQIAACAARPELPARSAGNPAGIDLSGSWVLRGESGEPLAKAGGRAELMRLPRAGSRNPSRDPGRAERSKRSDNSAVHVFIESGRSLKITQTEHGLFVSYDRAIVEEYTFGENRIISLGPIEAQRVSGWNAAVLVVETMDERGVTLTESWELAGEGSELVRALRIMDDEEELYSSQQFFDRT